MPATVQCDGIAPWESDAERNGRVRVINAICKAVMSYTPGLAFRSAGETVGDYELMFGGSVDSTRDLSRFVQRRTGVSVECGYAATGGSGDDDSVLVVTVSKQDMFRRGRYSRRQVCMSFVYGACMLLLVIWWWKTRFHSSIVKP
jgi:hypothetical protein